MDNTSWALACVSLWGLEEKGSGGVDLAFHAGSFPAFTMDTGGGESEEAVRGPEEIVLGCIPMGEGGDAGEEKDAGEGDEEGIDGESLETPVGLNRCLNANQRMNPSMRRVNTPGIRISSIPAMRGRIGPGLNGYSRPCRE